MQKDEIAENAMYLLLFAAHIQSNNRINSWHCPLFGVYVSILSILLCVLHFVSFHFSSHFVSLNIYLRCFDSLSICSIWNWCTIGRKFWHHRSSSVSLVFLYMLNIFSAYASRSNLSFFFLFPFTFTLYLQNSWLSLEVVDHHENGLFAHNI